MTENPLERLISDLNIGDPDTNPLYTEEDGMPTKKCLNFWGKHWRTKHDTLQVSYLGLKLQIWGWRLWAKVWFGICLVLVGLLILSWTWG